jgi:CheY-like chemotaxis protein
MTSVERKDNSGNEPGVAGFDGAAGITPMAMVAHEVRTPLDAMMSLLELLNASGLEGKPKQYVQLLNSAAKALGAVVNNVLDLEKLVSGTVKPVAVPFDAISLIEDIEKLFAEACRNKNIELVTAFPAPHSECLIGDPDRIRQIVTNFVSNAVKFTDRGGITITCRLTDAGGDRAIMRIEVEDTGCGIAEELQAELFKPYRQAPGTGKPGTGLGLAISAIMARLLGGEIGCLSTPGAGSMFWLEIDCPQSATAAHDNEAEKGAADRTTDRETSDLAGRLKGLTVLVAEDNRINQRLLATYLAGFGCSFELVGDGEAAVAYCRTRPCQLVLMDINMPHLDGLAAAAKIRQLDGPMAQIPILVMSSDRPEEHGAEPGTRPYDDLIVKPIIPADLFEKMCRAVYSKNQKPAA